MRIQLGLVATEVSADGTARSPSIQGLSTTLSLVFVVRQRTGRGHRPVVHPAGGPAPGYHDRTPTEGDPDGP